MHVAVDSVGGKHRVIYVIEGAGVMKSAADVRAYFDALEESAASNFLLKSPSQPAVKNGGHLSALLPMAWHETCDGMA